MFQLSGIHSTSLCCVLRRGGTTATGGCSGVSDGGLGGGSTDFGVATGEGFHKNLSSSSRRRHLVVVVVVTVVVAARCCTSGGSSSQPTEPHPVPRPFGSSCPGTRQDVGGGPARAKQRPRNRLFSLAPASVSTCQRLAPCRR